MQVLPLQTEERLKTGCSHVAVIDYTDLNTVAATATSLKVFPYIARDLVDKAFFDLVTPFDGGATTSLGLTFGWNGATADSANGLIATAELHLDATEVLAGDATGGAFATLRTGFAAQEAGDLEATFTSAVTNLTALTQGRVRLYFNVVRLTDLRGINNT